MPLVSLHTSNILTSQVNYSRQLGYLCCCLWDIFQALIIPPPPPPPHPPTHTFIISTAPSFHQFSRPWEKGAFSHPHPLPPPSGLSSSHTLCFTCVQWKDWRMKLTQRMGSWKSVALMKRRRRSPWTSDFSVPVPPPPPTPPDMAQHKLQASTSHATVTRDGGYYCLWQKRGECRFSTMYYSNCGDSNQDCACSFSACLKLCVWNLWG